MSKLQLYMFFHLNLMFSSIEEEQRVEVIQKCYWPILEIPQKLQIPVAIEASALTLQLIADYDFKFIQKLKLLIKEKKVEFIGSGYTQLIGPLVPAEVNNYNFVIGNELYREVLGKKPEVVLVNEQAYSAGMIEHYLQNDYQAIVMEWENAATVHSEWQKEWRYYPQYAVFKENFKIPVIWNRSIAFQKFQRYVYDEMEMEEYIQYLLDNCSKELRTFPLYGSDAEVFNFRPGRFSNETKLLTDEWQRIFQFLKEIKKYDEFEFILPSQVLKLLKMKNAGKKLVLESITRPIPVKKQSKYNIVRWAVTGRDDLDLNTRCWKIYEILKKKQQFNEKQYWQKLCYLWSSDFRTHITDCRWHKLHIELSLTEKELGIYNEKKQALKSFVKNQNSKIKVSDNGRYIDIIGEKARLKLNYRKGLAIEGLWLGDLEGMPLLGTIIHGFYDNMALAADWFSGHTIIERVGSSKITDLTHENCHWFYNESGDFVLECKTKTEIGFINKTYTISKKEADIKFDLCIEIKDIFLTVIRVAHLTFYPCFEKAKLFIETANGGYQNEKFLFCSNKNKDSFEHGRAVSSVISAQEAFGVTNGLIILGDEKKKIKIFVDKTVSALIAMATFIDTKDNYFLRLCFSASELDETKKVAQEPFQKIKCSFRYTL